MADLVDPKKIEEIVGEKRHSTFHLGRARSSDKIVYILHSKECVAKNADLRDCNFSIALDMTPDPWTDDLWDKMLDKAVVLAAMSTGLTPIGVVAHHHKKEKK